MPLPTCLPSPRALASSRVIPAALIALLLAAVLLPLAPSAGAAGSDNDSPAKNPAAGPIIDVIPEPEPTETPQVSVDGPILVDPTPTPPVVVGPDDPDLLDPTPEVGIDDDDYQVRVGAIEIAKINCPPGIDAYNLTLYDLSLNCQDQPSGIVFDLVVNDGGDGQTVATQATFDVVAGGVRFDNLTPNLYFAVEQTPAGYGEPIVYCQNAADPNGDYQQMLVFVGQGSGFSYQLQGGDELSCLWYNIPAGDAGEAYVTVHKHLCPVGADLYSADRDALEAACPEPLADVEFSFESILADGSSGGVASALTDIDGLAFHQVQSTGTLAVTETVPAGYGAPIVYCGTIAADPVLQSYQPHEPVDGRINLQIASNAQIYCDWYNVPVLGDGTIYVQKHGCPLDFDPTGLGHFDLASACQEAMNGVVFAASDGANVFGYETTGAEYDSAVEFAGLPHGVVRIIEQIPAGYGTPIVFCKDPIAGTDFEPMAILDGNQTLTILQPGQVLMCDWFNVSAEFEGGDEPTEGDGSILVRKFACEYSYDAYNASYFDLASTCPDVQSGVEFLLADGNGATWTGTTGDFDAGSVEFANLPTPGAYVILEQVPAGYGEPVVFCKDPIDPNGAWAKSTVAEGNQILEVIDAGHVLICDWFNVPTAGYDVTVIKAACPADFNVYGADFLDFEGGCLEIVNGVPFTLTTEGYDHTRVSGDDGNGNVTFADVPPGVIVLREEIPAGYGPPVVYCTDVVAGQSSEYFEAPVYGGVIELPTVGGLICLWFNIPATDEGQIEVVKYWCDADVYDEAACELYTEGQEFSLYAPGGGDPVFFTTGPDGGYSVSAGAGEWILGEGDGGWCYAESNRAVQPQPLPNPGFDGSSLLVEVEPGQKTVIEVYNCDPWAPGDSGDPEDDGSSTGGTNPVPVKSLPNTGAGLRLAADGHVGSAATAILAATLLAIVGVAIQRRRAS